MWILPPPSFSVVTSCLLTNTVTRFYFEDSIIPVLVSGVPLLVQKLKTVHKDDDIAIVFPDEGACKRFGRVCTYLGRTDMF